MQSALSGCLAWTKRCLFMCRRGRGVTRSMATTASMNNVPKLWIDSDCGVDDVQGLFIVLASQQFDVIGISSVRGNVGSLQAAKNIASVLNVCGREDIPVYIGLDAPITQPPPPIDPDWFGIDGLGDTEGQRPPAKAPLDNACCHLVNASLKHNDFHLLTIGPLTNIARACQLDSTFPDRVKSFTCMGGSSGKGNMPGEAEFNIYADPDAASVVLKNFFPMTKLITWELAKKCAWDLDVWLKDKSSAKARFMKAITEKPLLKEKKEHGEPFLWTGADPVAAAVLVSPSLVTKSRYALCSIDCTNPETMGKSLFQFETDVASSNVEVIEEINLPGFLQLLEHSLE